MDTIQFWGTHSIQRIALIQECFYKYDFAKVGAIVSTFLHELDGDVTLSAMVGGYYQKYVAIEKLKLQHQVANQQGIAICTDRIQSSVIQEQKR